jgi:hypothetical protein
MTSSVPAGQVDVDDWFDLDKYRQAAGVSSRSSQKKTKHEITNKPNELIDIELFDHSCIRSMRCKRTFASSVMQ